MESDAGKIVETLSGALSKKRTVETLVFSAMALQFYDWLLLLPQEVEYIWRARWNWSKALYLLTRYPPFIAVSMELKNLLTANPTLESCRRIAKVSIWLSFLGLAFAEAVLMVRTYAVWNRDKRVGIGLALLFVLCQTAAGVTMVKWVEGVHLIRNPYPEIIRGCVADRFTNLVFATWVVITIEEGVDLVLMMIKAVKTHREYRSSLAKVIYRDGIRFYLYIFCVTLVNVLITVLLSIDFATVGTTFEIVLHSTLACRLMIGMREAIRSCGRKWETFELSEIPNDDTLEFGRRSSESSGEATSMGSGAYTGPSKV